MRSSVLLLLVGLLALTVGCGKNARPDLDVGTRRVESAETRENAAFETRYEASLGDRTGTHSFPPGGCVADARIARVDEDHNIVLITLGSDSLPAIGDIMTVSRDDEFIGKLIIDKVGDDWASGHMDLDLTRISPRQGDSAF